MRQVKFGVLGAGGIACRKTIPALLRTENCRLVAAMNPANVAALASRFGGVRAYRYAQELVSDPEVEAVYIASTVACHAEHIRLAAAAGKHILREKPLTLGVQSGSHMVGSQTMLTRSLREAIKPGTSLTFRVNMPRLCSQSVRNPLSNRSRNV